MDYYVCIRKAIEKQILLKRRKFILFPFGEQGMLAKRILNEVFGIQEEYIIDNYLSQMNPKIKELSYLSQIDCSQYIILITSDNEKIYDELRGQVRKYVDDKYIVDIFERKQLDRNIILRQESQEKNYEVKYGKYSYSDTLKNNLYVESVGAFCSIHDSVDVVPNHAIDYISTHVFLFNGENDNWESHRGESYYFPEIKPKGKPYKNKKVIIGNDVWLGKNVIIANGAKIGNGVIAGAGAVIIKDVPDYAVVVGVPARIIRYRYTQEQIDKLNKIAWWEWPDEKIRKNYDDFFEDIDIFIKKHGVMEKQ